MDLAEARLEAVTEWFTRNGGWLHSSLEFAFSPLKGHFLRAKTDHDQLKIPKGTQVLSCPHSLTLSALNAVSSSQVFHKAQLFFRSGSVQSLDLPAEFLVGARPQCVAAIVLATQKTLLGDHADVGFWDPYIACLPSLPEEVEQERHTVCTPMWWSEDDQKLLSGTNVEKGMKDLENAWRKEWERWSAILVPWGVSHTMKLSWELFKWSLTILGSRAFGSSQIQAVLVSDGQRAVEHYDPDVLLYPVMDMLNHNPRTLNHWHSDSESFYLVCEDEPSPGDEIFNYYGPKDSNELLLSFGFCIEDNPFESYPLKLASKHAYQEIFEARFPGKTEQSPAPTANTIDIVYGNTRTPLPSHSASQTFFIRSKSASSKLDLRIGYPNTASLDSNVHSWKDVFPEELLCFFALSAANERELQSIQESPRKTRPTELYRRLGQRNETAVASRLLTQLAFEHSKFNHYVAAIAAGASSQRLHLAKLYRAEKNRLLNECLYLIHSYVGVSTGTSAPQVASSTLTTPKSHPFLTLANAYRLLISLPSPTSTAARLVLAAAGTNATNPTADADTSMLLWTVFLGLTSNFINTHQNSEQDNSAVSEVLSRYKVFARTYPRSVLVSNNEVPIGSEAIASNSSTEDVQDLISDVQTFIDAVRTSAPSRFRTDDTSNPLRASYWNDATVSEAIRVVQEETVDVPLDAEQRLVEQKSWMAVFGSENTQDYAAESGNAEPVPVLYFPVESREEQLH